jgi:hypothetical protein
MRPVIQQVTKCILLLGVIVTYSNAYINKEIHEK